MYAAFLARPSESNTAHPVLGDNEAKHNFF